MPHVRLSPHLSLRWPDHNVVGDYVAGRLHRAALIRATGLRPDQISHLANPNGGRR